MSNIPSDPLTGVKCFTIGGRTVERRQRLRGMTDEERRWRAQFLKDQVLPHGEPREVPELYKATNHWFRRLYKTPLCKFENALASSVGPSWAYGIRYYITKTSAFIFALYVGYYHIKYSANDFCLSRGIEFVTSRERMYPDHPNYPNFPVKSKQDYYDEGFYSSVLAQKAVKPPPVQKKKPPVPNVRADGTEIICPPPKRADD